MRKNVFITGASRGIGHATAKYFVEKGWRAITCSRDIVPKECAREDTHAHITADLSSGQPLDPVVDKLDWLLDGEPLDALVNNAGFSPKSDDGARMGCLDGDMQDWHDVFSVNFFTPVYFSRKLAHRLPSETGTIVNITSIAGHRVHPFAGAAYATSKAALWALTRELAADLAHMSIRVNAVCPGEINTAILSPGTEALIEKIPLRRLGSPREVASTVFYLCDEASSYITGAEIPVNGGQDVY